MDEEDRYTRITLRLPKDLHTVLDMAAAATSKSLNAEIVGRLLQSIELPKVDESEELQRDLLDALSRDAELETQIGRLEREQSRIIKTRKELMRRIDRARITESPERRADLDDEMDVLRIEEQACVARLQLLQRMQRKTAVRIRDLTRALQASGALVVADATEDRALAAPKPRTRESKPKP